jgi:hypothetical protein
MKRIYTFTQFINESDSSNVYFHGSTDRNLKGERGIHIGTEEAATQALEARIGVPAKGSWDGTREYGKTLLAGKKTLQAADMKDKITGFNCSPGVPEEDYFPGDRKERAVYSDGTKIPLDCKPEVFQVELVGQMSNTPSTPHNDVRANSMILRGIKAGNARRGFYYINDGEDAGSISAVVPDSSFLKTIS